MQQNGNSRCSPFVADYLPVSCPLRPAAWYHTLTSMRVYEAGRKYNEVRDETAMEMVAQMRFTLALADEVASK